MPSDTSRISLLRLHLRFNMTPHQDECSRQVTGKLIIYAWFQGNSAGPPDPQFFEGRLAPELRTKCSGFDVLSWHTLWWDETYLSYG